MSCLVCAAVLSCYCTGSYYVLLLSCLQSYLFTCPAYCPATVIVNFDLQCITCRTWTELNCLTEEVCIYTYCMFNHVMAICNYSVVHPFSMWHGLHTAHVYIFIFTLACSLLSSCNMLSISVLIHSSHGYTTCIMCVCTSIKVTSLSLLQSYISFVVCTLLICMTSKDTSSPVQRTNITGRLP